MNRLTKFCKEHNTYLANGVIGNNPLNSNKVDKIIQKLGYYEDLEEKGCILKFNIGDTIYVVKNNEKQKCVIKSIIIENNNITYWYSQEKYIGEWKFNENSIGKTVFLTEEDANNKLNEV